ncbi:conserved exported hypothetical protein [Candidatus Sulfopaludibacter sp. SbA6]|nr:conserved exported hypothetical protein [Candidatus Sulfopaludibacter sp. SbA6]
MGKGFPRRSLFQLAGAAALLRSRVVSAQQAPPPGQAPTVPGQPGPGGRGRGMGMGGNTEPFPELERRATVALIHGDERRKNVYDALMAVDKDLQPKLRTRKYVVIKPNFVNTVNQLAASHADAMRGILDYLSERFKGPVVIAESSAGNTQQGYDNFKFTALPAEYKKQQLQLIDLNVEAKFERITVLDKDLHIVPMRLAARLLDPEAFVISSAMLKTHNTAIASLSIKNMVLGAPLHNAPNETTRWNEKRKFHIGLRMTHYNMLLTAQRLAPSWGASVIDGYEGMEGNGPNSGTPVPSRLAIASADFVAADRIGAQCMGVDPEWMGYVKYCGELHLGQFDESKIEVIGAKVADVKKAYRMHPDIDRELQWQGPMTELPFNLGWVTPQHGTGENA